MLREPIYECVYRLMSSGKCKGDSGKSGIKGYTFYIRTCWRHHADHWVTMTSLVTGEANIKVLVKGCVLWKESRCIYSSDVQLHLYCLHTMSIFFFVRALM